MGPTGFEPVLFTDIPVASALGYGPYSVVPGDLESSGRSWGVAQSRGLVVRRVILGITFRPILE